MRKKQTLRVGGQKNTWIEIVILGITILIFCYLRLTPIYTETVGYTFDQGRDFLKAAEIVLYKNPTFIGPTTGIMGIYHGAWWYYLLSIGFIIFQGVPIGFYYLNFFIQFGAFLLFYIFTKKLFNTVTALLLSFLVATSPYLIFNSIFMVNNVMAMPAFLLLLVATLSILDKKKRSITILKKTIPVHLVAGLALGFTAEFEFAFGLLLMPTYLLLLAFFQWKTKFFRSFKEVIYMFLGLLFAFLPRLFFEIKNSFPQTKVLLKFFFEPQFHTPKPYDAVFRDRIEVFQGYYGGLFMNDYVKTIITLTALIFAVFFIFRKKFSVGFIFLTFLGILLFIFSTLYKDTFWSYYYDGIQYLYLLLLGYLLSAELKTTKSLQQYGKLIILTVFIMLAFLKVNREIRQPIPYDGIKVQKDIVDYIHGQIKTTPYCVIVYTPPVIPYTYDYLFVYKRISKNIPDPLHEWYGNQCWYIIEYDDNKERKDEWLEKNIPKEAKQVSDKRIKDVDIQLWKR